MRIEPVVAIDPGKLTGVAHVVRKDNKIEILETKELDEDEVIPWLRPILTNWNREDGRTYPLRVVIERFLITLETAKKSQAPFSLEVIGAVKQACRDVGYPTHAIAFQSPADAKTAFPNGKLKRIGVWHKGGEGHAIDALRHAVLYLARTGWKDSRISSDFFA